MPAPVLRHDPSEIAPESLLGLDASSRLIWTRSDQLSARSTFSGRLLTRVWSFRFEPGNARKVISEPSSRGYRRRGSRG